MSEYTIPVYTYSTTGHKALSYCKEVPVENMGYNKLVNERDEVAILISPGFGSGWYTCNAYRCNNNKEMEKLIKDSRVIRYAFDESYRANFDSIESFFENEIGLSDLYFGGFDNVVVEFVPKHIAFRITEYDGAEGIEHFNPNLFMTP